jgi:RecA/RadA recombinase
MSAILSTGLLGLDIALGSAGIPRGHLTEIYGPEKCGKTALCLLIVSEAQKAGCTAAYIDIDQTLDAARAARLGVKADDLILARPENATRCWRLPARYPLWRIRFVVVDWIVGLMTPVKTRNAHGVPPPEYYHRPYASWM